MAVVSLVLRRECAKVRLRKTFLYESTSHCFFLAGESSLAPKRVKTRSAIDIVSLA